MIARKQRGWLTARVGDELMMMSAEAGQYIALSAVGARIWELIETPRSIDELCGQIESEYEVAPAVCREETLAFLEKLGTYGAATIETA